MAPEEQEPRYTRNANILCIVSLVLGFAMPALLRGLMTAGYGFMYKPGDEYAGAGITMWGQLLSALAGLSPIAGLVTMIVARVKYPKSTFAKVVMWIYIAAIILGAIGIMLLIVACFSCLGDLQSGRCD